MLLDKHNPLFSLLTALGWSQPCDVWSIGCILIEYYLGFTVFPVRNCRNIGYRDSSDKSYLGTCDVLQKIIKTKS